MRKLLPRRLPETAQCLLFWTLCFALLWSLLTAGNGWYLGLPALLLAAYLAFRLNLHPWRFRALYLPRFLVFFLGTLFRDAVRVALRAFRSSHSFESCWVYHNIRSRDPRNRLILVAMLGLFPGTLAARIEGDVLHIHMLGLKSSGEKRALELEAQLERLLGPDHLWSAEKR